MTHEATTTVHAAHLRRCRLRAAGLLHEGAAPERGTLAEVLGQHGWQRFHGGVDVLVSAWARGTAATVSSIDTGDPSLAVADGPLGLAHLAAATHVELAAVAAGWTVSEPHERQRLLRAMAAWFGPLSAPPLARHLGTPAPELTAELVAAGLVPIATSEGCVAHGLADDIEKCAAAQQQRSDGTHPAVPVVALLGADDPIVAVHGAAEWFAPHHHGLRLPVWGRGTHTLGGADHLSMRTVLAGDRLVGFWAWDPDRRTVEVALLDHDASWDEPLRDAVARLTERLGRRGDAHMTYMDSLGTERARLEAMRNLLG